MLKRAAILLACLVVFIAALAGERGGLVFTDTIHDFGDIDARSGRNTCVFEFVNASDSAIYILGALSSCGCTIPEYPHEAIQPGQRATVRVTYDTIGRPLGPFQKSIHLTIGGAHPPIILRIQGTAVDTTPNQQPLIPFR